MIHQRQLPDQPPPCTVAEIDDRIATDRLRYITAFFAGLESEARYWVYEIARLENLRTIVQRRDVAS
jgi:hypothetical protein